MACPHEVHRSLHILHIDSCQDTSFRVHQPYPGWILVRFVLSPEGLDLATLVIAWHLSVGYQHCSLFLLL